LSGAFAREMKAIAAAETDNAAVRVELSHTLSALGHVEDAITAAREAARIEPARAEPLEQLASIFADVGDAMRLTPIADGLVKRFPTRDEGHYYQAAALFLAGRATDAERSIWTLLSANTQTSFVVPSIRALRESTKPTGPRLCRSYIGEVRRGQCGEMPTGTGSPRASVDTARAPPAARPV
jgi:cytochrome c-type biogenesis protein CcmH/NrfG